MAMLPPIIAHLLADTTDFNAKLDEAQAHTLAMTESGNKSFGGFGKVATVAFLAVAAAAVSAGVAGVDLALKYQTSTASLAANAGISVAAANRIGAAFLNQAFQTTFSAQQTEAAYAGVVGQLGVMNGKALSSAQALAFMTQAQDLAEASGTALSSATADLAKTMQAFQVPLGGAAQAANDLFNAAKDTGTSVDILSQSLARARGTMGAAAPPLSVMTGLLVDLTAHGETGRQAMSALGSAFTGIISPSAAVIAAQKQLGVTFLTAKHALDPVSQILTELQPKLAGMSAAQAAATLKSIGFGAASAKLATTIQAGPAVLAKYIDSVSKAGSAQAAADKNAGTLEGSIKKLSSGFQDILTQLGQFLIPILTKVVGVVASVVSYFDRNRAAAVALGIGIGAITAVLGTFAVATGIAKLASITSAVAMGAWGAATAVWSGITTAATVVMGAFNLVMDANPIALIILAVAGLIAIGVLLITHWKQVTAAAAAVWHDITGFFKSLWHDITGIFNGIASFLGGVWHTITTGVSTGFDAVIAFITGIPKKILDALGDLGNLLLNAGKAILTGFLNGILSIWKNITGFFGGIGNWIKQHKGPIEADAVMLVPHGMAIMSGFHAGLKAGIPPILSTLNGLSTSIGGALNVRGTGLTLLGSPSLARRSAVAGAGAAGGSGGSVTYAPTYNMPITGDVSPQTVRLIDQMLQKHDQELITVLNAGRR
jgi:TP901 family phage tail tape measure protein